MRSHSNISIQYVISLPEGKSPKILQLLCSPVTKAILRLSRFHQLRVERCVAACGSPDGIMAVDHLENGVVSGSNIDFCYFLVFFLMNVCVFLKSPCVKKLFAAEKSSLIFAQEMNHVLLRWWSHAMTCPSHHQALGCFAVDSMVPQSTWCFIPECHSCIAKEA